MKVRLRRPIVVELVIDEVRATQEIDTGRTRTSLEQVSDATRWALPVPLPDEAAIVIDAEQAREREEILLSGGDIVVAEPDDWILTGVAGDRLPCKPDVFHALYEPA